LKFLFEISHPSRVHNFKHVIWELQRRGHDVKIGAIKKEITYELLNAYNLEFTELGENKPGNIIRKIPLIFEAVYNLHNIASEFNPDVFISSYSPISAIVSRVHGKKHIAFHDTENTGLTDPFTAPFTDIICTPNCFKRDFGKKQVRFEGYKELCYLHPKYFKPDPSVLEKINANVGDPLIVLRLVSFSAHHDIGQHGLENPIEMIHRLEKYGRVILSSETHIPKLQQYEVKLPPEDIHSLLYYSNMYVGDGSTMATEAGVLGTPSLYISSFKGTLGNFIELEDRYGLVYSYETDREALEKAVSILEDPNSKKVWASKREVLLKNTIDVNEFFYNLITKND